LNFELALFCLSAAKIITNPDFSPTSAILCGVVLKPPRGSPGINATAGQRRAEPAPFPARRGKYGQAEPKASTRVLAHCAPCVSPISGEEDCLQPDSLSCYFRIVKKPCNRLFISMFSASRHEKCPLAIFIFRMLPALAGSSRGARSGHKVAMKFEGRGGPLPLSDWQPLAPHRAGN